ncbi:MAG TPA: S8 family serine peptidase, partial [Vicinamibacterales bacterium]|nr:S8 family serine peptidase [Vicinamibacterales bacterium]
MFSIASLASHLRRGAAAAIVLTVAASAQAQPHRARLSSDIADRLARRIEAPTEVIVAAPDAAIGELAARYGATVRKRIQGGAVLEATGGQIDALSQDPAVGHIAGNATVYRMMAVTTQATGADQVWSGLDALRGVTGRGIGVAVIDSGIAQNSPVGDRVVASADFTRGAAAASEARDEYGHGTHVAGIIAESARDGYSGMAPGAWLINLKALGNDGSGKTADVIEAIDWAIRNRRTYNIRIINVSLGHPVFESYVDDPLCQAAQRAADAGILVVAAAGNFGKTAEGRPIVGGVIAPGNAPSVLTVGAVNTRGTAGRDDDVMATYSSRGPTAIDGVLKPELVAPGNRIVAASAPGSYLSRTYPEHVTGSGTSAYIELSGTSMSSAVASGAAALLLEARPGLTPAQVKAALQLTSSRVAGAGLIEAGAGSLNVAAALGLVT